MANAPYSQSPAWDRRHPFYVDLVQRLEYCRQQLEQDQQMLERLFADVLSAVTIKTDTGVTARTQRLQERIATLTREIQELLVSAHFARRERASGESEGRTIVKKLKLVGGILLCCALFWAAPVSAQTKVVQNPTTVSFTPSPDHGTTLSDGTMIVTRYELRMFLVGQTVPVAVRDLAKPVPVSGTISVTNAAWFVPLAPNVELISRVAAIGPGGEGVSASSNPFAMLTAPGAATALVIK